MRIRSNKFPWIVFFLVGTSPATFAIAKRVDGDMELFEDLNMLEGINVDESPRSSYGQNYANLEGRVLDSYGCNTALGPPISLEQIQVGLSSILDLDGGNSTFAPTEDIKAIKNKVMNLQYGVQLWKVCASCLSESLTGYGCESSDYGFDVLHSGLLMIPVKLGVNGNYFIIQTRKKLQTWIQSRTIAISQFDSDFIINSPQSPSHYIPLLVASTGMLSIIPHKTGFDTSSSLTPSIVVKKSYSTSTVPLYYKSANILKEISDGKTTLGKDIYCMGYSEGGYGSLATADAFDQHGFKIVKAMSGGAPLKIRSLAVFGSFETLLSVDSFPFYQVLYLALASIAFTNTRPDVPNNSNGISQPFLNPDLKEDFLDLFAGSTGLANCVSIDECSFDPIGLLSYLNQEYPQLLVGPEIFNPSFLSFAVSSIHKRIDDPCIMVPKNDQIALGVDKICEALDENDLTEIVQKADYEVELCYGELDELTPIENAIPSKLKYTFRAKHDEAMIPCSMSFLANLDTETTGKMRKKSKSKKSWSYHNKSHYT